MDVYEAMRERHSVRQYTDRKIEGEVLEALEDEIRSINEENGLRISLILDEPKAFNKLLLKTVVKFKNANNYLIIAGPDNEHLNIDAGYYGEKLVLFAQTLGLNTCWAMMAGRDAADKTLEKGYKAVIDISIGYGENQGVPHKSKPMSEFGDTDGAPDWFVRGLEYAMLAPTGVNKQGFRFERDDDKVRMIFGKSTLSQIDAGIVRLHFELGAGKENFTWVE